MPFTLVQGGENLYVLNAAGGLRGPLTLPESAGLSAGPFLRADRTPRFAKFNRYIVMVNSPARPLLIDTEGTVYPLTPDPPPAVAMTGSVTGTLSGTYLALQTFVIRDASGNTITESGYSPYMASAVTITNKKLFVLKPNSPQPQVNAVHVYRTATNGSTYFKWLTMEHPELYAVADDGVSSDASDASLGAFAAEDLGGAPDLTLIAEWSGKLWGVDRTNIDVVRYTQAGLPYAWAALNAINCPHIGEDEAGVTALIPRRNALGVARKNLIAQITGTSRSNYTILTVPGGENRGVLSQESVVVDNDIAYFLWRDGVYKWDSMGVSCVSDGKVRGWFTKNNTFNRGMFHKAAAQVVGRRYRLFLAAANTSQLNRWVEYDMDSGLWFGPHKTDAFTPQSCIDIALNDGTVAPMVGTRDGFVLAETDDASDRQAHAIPVQVISKNHDNGDPISEKFFGEMQVWSKGEPTGSLTVTPWVGPSAELVETAPLSLDLTRSRQGLDRVGNGETTTLVWEQSARDQPFAIYGYNIDPVVTLGER